MTLQEMLAQIVAGAQAEVECPCPCHNQGLRGHYHTGEPPCHSCHGTGKVPDPRYKALVEALREKCSACDGTGWVWSHGGLNKITHSRCGGTGRVLRTEWQQGELAGVLKHWVESRLRTLPEETLEAEKWYSLAANLGLCFGQDDCDDWAVRIVLRFMGKEAPHATE